MERCQLSWVRQKEMFSVTGWLYYGNIQFCKLIFRILNDGECSETIFCPELLALRIYVYCWSGSTFENFAVLDCDAASCGNSLPTFWDNWSHLQGSDRFPQMIVRNHHHSLRHRPEERSYQLLRGGSPKSLISICSRLKSCS